MIKSNYLHQIIKVNKLDDLQPDYPRGTLVLSDSQAVLDRCSANRIPVAAYEHDDITGLNCDHILLSLDDVDDIVFERIYRRYESIPWDIGYTDRTFIREFGMEDLDDLFELYSKPGMTDYMEPLFSYEEEKEYQENYIKYIYKLYDFGMWLIYDKISNELIGRAGLEIRDTCDRKEQAELGFCISSDRWGQGLGYEVCSKIIQIAGEEYGLTSLIARCDPANAASIHLLEKLGFKLEGYQPDGDLRYFMEIC